jgi:hypothetical protein
MANELTHEQIKAAVEALQGSYGNSEEYGLTDEDAEDGLLFALESLGIPVAFKSKRVALKKAEIAKEEATRRAYYARRAAMTPAERKDEDERIHVAMNAMMDRVFTSSPMFNLMEKDY